VVTLSGALAVIAANGFHGHTLSNAEAVEMTASYSIRLSTEHKGRRRREPVWVGRFRVGQRDSAKVLGKRAKAPPRLSTPDARKHWA
jgi:hypothetical protein